MMCLTTTMIFANTAMAEDAGFDLSSQRHEIQTINPVPGQPVDHHGIVINPTPQLIDIDREHMLDIRRGFSVNDVKGTMTRSLEWLPRTTNRPVTLTIDYGSTEAAPAHVKPVSGAYTLRIDRNGVKITGYDERGAFYGIQTLRQILSGKAAANGKVPYITVRDYPDLPDRGVVEGFYGNPWPHATRMALIDFYGRHKLNTYHYGPKDDPYHSSPYWREPYPEPQAANIRELVEAANRNYVNFVWAIHPGKDIKWNEEDYNNLLHKFNLMYDLGVRHFAIFFDDISGEGTNPNRQVELLNRLTKEFVEAKGDVSPLIVCPTDYSRLWANPAPDGALATYGKNLHPDIKVMWTGDVVCSDLTTETMDFVNSLIRRPGYYWWNYPVQDYARNFLLQGPVYGLSSDITDKYVSGFVSNPMEHGIASKLALYGVADYTWNPDSYNAMDNWYRGTEELMPGAGEAYRTFAIHSCESETGYRRDESWSTPTFTLDAWPADNGDALLTELMEVASTPAIIESVCADTALMAELRPWLVEQGKLGLRGAKAIRLARDYRALHPDPYGWWAEYTDNIMSDAECKAYNEHTSGSRKLQPFYVHMMDDMADGFFTRLTGRTPRHFRGMSSYANSESLSTKLMLDGDTATFYTSNCPQTPGDWIGVDLLETQPVHTLAIQQGRHPDDTDYYDTAIVEYSTDGTIWKSLTDTLKCVYDISWSGEPVEARYLRLRRIDSPNTSFTTVRRFDVNPIAFTPGHLGLSAADPENALRAFDSNLHTTASLNGTIAFDIDPETREIVILAGKNAADYMWRQIDKEGNVVQRGTSDSAMKRIPIASPAVKRIDLTGNAVIYEILMR